MSTKVYLPVNLSYFNYNACAASAGIIANSKFNGHYWFINNCTQLLVKKNEQSDIFEILIPMASPWHLPFSSEEVYYTKLIKSSFHSLVKNLLNTFHYIYFWGADSCIVFNNKEKFFLDGLIVGYDDAMLSYSIVLIENGLIKQKEIGQEELFDAIYSINSESNNMIHAFYIDHDVEYRLDLNVIKEGLKDYINPKTDEKNQYSGIYIYDMIQDHCITEKEFNSIYPGFLEHKMAMYKRILIVEDCIINNNRYYSKSYKKLLSKIKNINTNKLDFLTLCKECEIDIINGIIHRIDDIKTAF